MAEMNEELAGRIVPRILSEFGFKKSDDGRWLNQGKCPACGKKSLFTSAQSPWVLRCGRENKCGMEYSVRDLYPEEFGQYNKRFPSTPQNPNATADAYMREARGLNTMRMKSYYTQENGGAGRHKAARPRCVFICPTVRPTWSVLLTRSKSSTPTAVVRYASRISAGRTPDFGGSRRR